MKRDIQTPGSSPKASDSFGTKAQTRHLGRWYHELNERQRTGIDSQLEQTEKLTIEYWAAEEKLQNEVKELKTTLMGFDLDSLKKLREESVNEDPKIIEIINEVLKVKESSRVLRKI